MNYPAVQSAPVTVGVGAGAGLAVQQPRRALAGGAPGQGGPGDPAPVPAGPPHSPPPGRHPARHPKQVSRNQIFFKTFSNDNH